MVVPVAHHAAQEVGPAQERTVAWRRATDGDVVAAAGADVATIDHELLAVEAARARFVVDHVGDLDRIAPRG